MVTPTPAQLAANFKQAEPSLDPAGSSQAYPAQMATPPRSAASSSRTEYADRFIPARRGINLQEGFALLPDSPPKPRESPSGGGVSENTRDDNLATYSMLLRNELLVDESPAPCSVRRRSDGGAGLISPTANTNLFRYRVTPSPRDGSLPFSLSPVGTDPQHALPGARRTPRKIPSVPYKVLDAPSLQDDFYVSTDQAAHSDPIPCSSPHRTYVSVYLASLRHAP